MVYEGKRAEEIKSETLRLMFATEDASNFSHIKGVDDYKDKMDGAIYRAIIRICQAKKAGIRSITVKNSKDLDFDNGIDLKTLPRTKYEDEDSFNMLMVDKVSIKYKNGLKKPYIAFSITDGETIYLDEYVPYDTDVTIFYYPVYVDLDSLRQDVASIIPYFVKSELYEEDEASMAIKARNMFEQQLMAIEIGQQSVQTQVVNVFGRF